MTKDDELRKKGLNWIAADERVQLLFGKALDAQERAAKAQDQHARVAAESEAMAAWAACRKLTGERDMIRRRAIEHAAGEPGGGAFGGMPFEEIARPELFETDAGAAFGLNMFARIVLDMTEAGDNFERAGVQFLSQAARGLISPFALQIVPGGRGVDAAGGMDDTVQALVASKTGYTEGFEDVKTQKDKSRLLDRAKHFYARLAAKHGLRPKKRETIRDWMKRTYKSRHQESRAQGRADAVAGRCDRESLLPKI